MRYPKFTRRTQRESDVLHTPGTRYARAKTAAWLVTILEQNVPLESRFFACLRWVAGGLRRPLQAVMHEAEKLRGEPAGVDVAPEAETFRSRPVTARRTRRKAPASPRDRLDAALEALHEASARSHGRLDNELAELYEEHPCLAGIIKDVAARECAAAIKARGKPVGPYGAALKRLERTFGLDEECRTLCEFVFINQNFTAVEHYFEDHLEVHTFGNRSILARMLNMTRARLQSCLAELGRCGLLDSRSSSRLRLEDCLLPFWETSGVNTEELFSRPLSGAALPLEAFHIAPEDAAHVKKLLARAGKTPVHILLYGAPGTGKSAFAHSLAQACGVKAWAVVSRERDGDKDRRASLTACLHVAAGQAPKRSAARPQGRTAGYGVPAAES